MHVKYCSKSQTSFQLDDTSWGVVGSAVKQLYKKKYSIADTNGHMLMETS